MNRAPHFGRGNRNPTLIVGAAIVAVVAVVLALLFVFRKSSPVPHDPDVVAVIVSGTAGAAQQEDFNKVLKYATDRGDVLVVASARHPDVAQSVSLAATGSYDLQRQQNQTQEVETAKHLYQAAVAPGGSTDLQMPFDAVYNIVHTIPHMHVLVAALGPVTEVAAGTSLNDPLTRGDPAASISRLPGNFVSSCVGWNLNVAEGNVQPSSLTEDQDREYWRRLMKSCGGQLTAWTVSIGVFPSVGEVSAWSGSGPCGITFELGGQTLFDTGKYQLLPGADQTLGSILARVKESNQPHLDIDGYTDSQGSASYNNVLSEERAKAVAKWFQGQGLSSSQVTVKGHGESNPIASNATDQGRQLNRRVVVTLTYRNCSQG